MEKQGTKEITVGTIGTWLKIDKDIADKIIENYDDINVSHNWYDFIIEEFCESITEYGFNVNTEDIQFTGFNSQGDGASFIGDVDIVQFLRKTKKLSKYKSVRRMIDNDIIYNTVNIERITSSYSHENTCEINDVEVLSWDYDLTKMQADKIASIEEMIEVARTQFCLDLYDALEKEYNNLTSRDSVLETLEINEYEFDEDGYIA